MFRITQIAAAVALAAYGATSLQAAPLSVIAQARGLPKEFHEHFFDVPLAVRIRLDRQELGEAMVTLSKDERVTLVEFTDTRDTSLSSTELDNWKAELQRGIALGPCLQQCKNGLVAAHYSLENSELSLLTDNAERDIKVSNYHQPPVDGSTGLMLRNQINLAGGEQQDSYGRVAVKGLTSVGNWTQTFYGQASRNDTPDQTHQYQVYELHTQKEWQDHFLRLGYFTPESIGLNRNLRTFGNSPDTAIGLMMGSSDSLSKDGNQPAIYPIYVTANRNATVEIYRNGALINSQQVAPGLQTLDTRTLPGGIYDIEVRLVEDGIVSSTTDELVYKPNNWSNPDQRWRYNIFAGRESSALSNSTTREDGTLTTGIAANYLLHPRAVVGISARKISEQNQLGTSLDLGIGATASLYANVYQTQNHGTGTDLQALYNYGSGSLIFSHSRSWMDNRNTWETLPDGSRIRQRHSYNGNISNSALGITHRLGHHDSLNARISHSDGYNNGIGLDAGWMRNSQLFGNDANWRLSVFDRAASVSSGNERNRGIDLSLNLAIGGPGKRLTASVGSRTSRDGDNDRNASIGYQQDLKGDVLRQVTGNVNADTYGVGLTGTAQFETDVTQGDLQLQRSSYNQNLSASLNMESTLLMGAHSMALSGQQLTSDAGMIVDLDSDIEDIELRADDLSGHYAVLRPGRNIIPVSAYQRGVVQFDFQGVHTPAASIQPARATYHLNKGGVAHQQVRLIKTVTVFGRLIDGRGAPLKGVHVLNHASRGVTEVDGFFSMELSAKTPTLEVVRGEKAICRLALDLKNLTREGDVLMTGDLSCVQDSGLEKIAQG